MTAQEDKRREACERAVLDGDTIAERVKRYGGAFWLELSEGQRQALRACLKADPGVSDLDGLDDLDDLAETGGNPGGQSGR